MSDIAELPNLGPRSVEVLRAAGITSSSQLRELGAAAAYVRAKRTGRNVSLNLLWALEGAISGLPWQMVARDHRTSLLLAVEAYERGAPISGLRVHRPASSELRAMPPKLAKERIVKTAAPAKGQSASSLIDARIAELGDWRGETLGRVRALIQEADPEVVEEWKWMGTPVWSHDGIICTGETYASKVKLTFAKGASLEDPAKLFNASLDGNARRAIDIEEGQAVDPAAFKALVRAAVALNASGTKARSKRAR